MFISHERTVEKLTKRFGMTDQHPSAVPADPAKHLQENRSLKSEGDMITNQFPYREAVGALLYF